MPKLARECLYLLPFPWYFENLKAEAKIEVYFHSKFQGPSLKNDLVMTILGF